MLSSSFRLTFLTNDSLVFVQHAPGQDQWGYEDAGERWLPVHTVESIVSYKPTPHTSFFGKLSCDATAALNISDPQLVSVISLLSADVPNLDSPANVDAAKQVRGEWKMTCTPSEASDSSSSFPPRAHTPTEDFAGYKKRVRRLVRQSAEEAYD